MAEPLQFDPRIFGGLAPDTGPVPVIAAPEIITGATTPATSVATVPDYATAVSKGMAAATVGKQQMEAAAVRPDASVLESMGAAFTTQATAKLVDWFNMPDFASRAGYTADAQMGLLKFTPTEAEDRFLRSAGREEEFEYRLDRVEGQRMAVQAMGDNTLISMAVAIADPLYLGLDMVGLGAANLARLTAVARASRLSTGAGRVIAGTVGGVGALAMGRVEQQVGAVSDGEVILNALLNGAATSMVYSGGKFVPKDGKYPGKALADEANALKKTIPEPVVKGVRDEAAHITVTRPSFAEARLAFVNEKEALVDALVPNELGERRLPAKGGLFDALATVSSNDADDVLGGIRWAAANGRVDLAEHLADRLDKLAADAKAARPGLSPDAAKYPDALAALERRAVQAEEAAAEGRKIVPKKAASGAPPQHDTRGLFDEHDLSYPAFRTIYGGVTLDAIAGDGGEFAELARVLRQAGGTMLDELPIKQMKPGRTERPYYLADEHAVYAPEDMLLNPTVRGNAQVLVHEVAHGLTVQKIHFGLLNPDTAHGKLVAELEDLRKTVVAEFERTGNKNEQSKYLAGDITEFAAGLFWGGSNFTYALAKIPVKGSVNALSKMVVVVRKMLGLTADRESVLTRALSITDDLISKPLDATMASGRVVSFAPKAGPDVAAQIVKNEDSVAAKAGNKLSWNLHKTLSGFSAKFREVADILVDNPVDMTGDSVVSQQRAIRADLAAHQYGYEDLLKRELAAQGAGLKERVFNPAKALEKQAAIEKEVAMELLQRERASSTGLAMPPKPPSAITRMADALDKAHAAALAEMKASGVQGAEDIAERSGYFSRKWDVTKLESLESALVTAGSTTKQARRQVVDMVARGMQRANPQWTPELAGDIANAVVSRTRAKGYFEDAAFRRHIGNETAKEVREILSQSGITNERLQRAMDAITGQVDEAGKLSALKHRIDIDMLYGIQVPGGTTIRIADLIDTNLTRITEGYLDRASASAAMARKGMATAGDIDKLRTEALHSVANPAERAEAAKLFDNTIAAIKGDPVGEDMADGMRKLQAVTQMVGLSSSGLWQLTETANIMAKYGMLKTIGHMVKTMPGFGALLGSVGKDKNVAEHLSNVLVRNSSQDIRLRPYINKLEDNFDMPIGDAVGMALTQAKQLVPYINAMKYVHGFQARLAANLITDTFSRAAKGDADALAALNKYGLESRTMDGIKPDLLAAGLDTAKWSDKTWEQVRAPLTKMMDDAVLRNRTGEIPAFAQFSQVGKFVFTFRSFVLGAHNKVLAGTLGREGFAGLGLLMAYQYPLTFLATAANQGMAGKDKSTEEIAKAALGQMGSLGLLGEFAGIISGEKQQFGAPGLIPIDRMYKAGSSLAQGNAGSSAAAFLTAMPVISIIPGTKALAETLKD